MYSFRLFVLCCLIIGSLTEDKPAGPKRKKNPADFTESDVDKLFEQWEVGKSIRMKDIFIELI